MNLDNLVEDVAREMIAAGPTPDLARRVRDRIAATPQGRAWPWRLAPLAGLAAAGAMIVIATLPRTSEVVATNSVRDVAHAAKTSEVVATVLGDNDLRDRVTSQARVTSRADADWQSRAIPALPEVQPLAIDRIQPIPLSIPLLEVEPLVVPAIGDDK